MIFPFSMYYFLKDPKKYLIDLQKKYGDPFPLSFPGVPTIWLTGQSELAKIIFTAAPDSFMASEHNPVGPLLGTSGLIMQSGPNHLELRKEFTPHFSKNNLKPMPHFIEEAFFDFYHSCPERGTLSLQNFAFKTTLKVILKLLFPHLSSVELHEAESLTEDFLKHYSAAFLVIPQWVPGTWGRFNRKKKQLDDRFYEFFQNGVAAGSLGPLRGFETRTKSEVLDHIRTFIVAGHETSATSLTWSLYYLYSNPLFLNRLKEDLKIDALFESKYLEAIVNEALRIHPPVPFVTRKIVNRDFQWGDRLFKRGEEVGVCLSILHQQEDIWPNGQNFDPERFIDHRYSPYEFAPFGGGIRKCIGAELSLMELKILVAYFVSYFDCDLITSPILKPSIMQITMGPKEAIWGTYQKKVLVKKMS